jgi:tetratricopeptide (TPR) repeat protein
LAQGKPQQAVLLLRKALDRRKQRLGGRSPAQLGQALMSDADEVSSSYIEPSAIADYCETQLQLAAVLTQVGRPYEAEGMLGEALLHGQINNDALPAVPRFWVLHASAAAAVGQRLAERRSDEAELFFQLAAALWNEMRAEFPQAEEFRSGLYGTERDWDWFRSTYPDHAAQAGTRESRNLNPWGTAFWSRTLGRLRFENEAWGDAIMHFTKSAELRNADQGYDRLHLAMAYFHLGKVEKAQIEYDRAMAHFREGETPDAELESIRRAAKRLFAERPTNDSD